MLKKHSLIFAFFICTAPRLWAKAETASIEPKITALEVLEKTPSPLKDLSPNVTPTTPLPLYVHAAIGLAANIAEKPLGHPLGFIQNRLMRNKPVLKENLTDLQHMRRFYRGFPLSMATSGPSTALEFTVNAFMKKVLAPHKAPTKTEQLIASGSAGIISAFLDTPVECTLLAQQMKDQDLKTTINEIAITKPYGTLDHIKTIRSLYRGLGPTIARNSLATTGNLGFMPVCYNAFKNYLPNDIACTTVSAIGTGGLTATITHPLTFIKTQLQGDLNKKEYKNSFDVARKVYAKHGFKAFFKGYVPRTIRYCVGAAIYKKTYDACIELANEKKQKNNSSLTQSQPSQYPKHKMYFPFK